MMNTRTGFQIFIVLAALSVWDVSIVNSQAVEDDFDVVAVPIGGSVRSGEKDLGGFAFNLDDMGFDQVGVPDGEGGFFPGLTEDIQVSKDKIQFTLMPGQAVRFLSKPMVVSTTSVFFTSFITVTGATPEQIGSAFLDIDHLGLIGVSLSLPGDRRLSEQREYSTEFQPRGRQVQLLLQCVGPAVGTGQPATIVWERLRVIDGFRSLDMAMGATVLTRQERFSPFPSGFTEDGQVTTPGGFISGVSDESYLHLVKEAPQTLLIAVKSATDVVRAVAPLDRLVIESAAIPAPQMLTAQMWVKRRSGTSGVFSIALGSAKTLSLGVYEMLVDLIPVDQWIRLECSMFFDHNAVPNSFLFLQLRDGACEILVDDITLRGRRDALYFWDDSLAPPSFHQ